MHLERIEISGFKSFADKTVIEFDKGVTAVVGPNGSGKSNLSEAIKWVLGEQSAKSLRGKKMDDIIFAGSQTRKPTNVAEVTLVLNNEDHFLPLEFGEIQITRRINRNGESDCFINKKPCRLKDIVNLFMDSGLGKDSFSIISQGKVETIFHNKPEERRGMIEEVAGVLKYKTRKNEASRKLEKTQENLDRVEDILFEIEKQLAPLAQQKEKALLYQSKKEALSSVDIALMVAEIESMSAQMTVVTNELANCRASLETIRENISLNDETYTNDKIKLNKIEVTIQHVQEKYVDVVQMLEKVTGEHNLSKERLAFSKQTKGQQEFAQYEKQEEKRQLTQELEALLVTQADIKKRIQVSSKALTTLKKQEELLNTSSVEVVEQQRQLYIDALQEQTKAQNTIVSLEKELQQLNNQASRLTERYNGLSTQQKTLNLEQEQLEKSHLEAKQVVDVLTKRYTDTEKQLMLSKQKWHEQQTKLNEQQQQLTQLQARKHSLQDLDEDFAGYYQGVRAVLKEKEQLVGVHGSLAQLIEVPKNYTVAIDIALGANLQHIVVKDEQSATKAIQFLKAKKLGRATFLPVNIIQPRYLSDDILQTVSKMKGFVGVASELVNTQPAYKNIVQNALGQTIVSATIDEGLQMAKAIKYRSRIVTLDGEVVHAGGSMTGGATAQKGQSLLSRSATLKELTASIKILKEQLDVLKEQVSTLDNESTTLQKELQTIQQEGTQKRLSERELEVSLQRAKQEYAQVAKQIEHVTNEQTLLSSEKNDIQQQLELANQTFDAAKMRLEEVKLDLERLSSSQEDKVAQLAQLQPKIQDETTQLALAKEQEVVCSSNIDGLEQRIEQLDMSLEALVSQHTLTEQTFEEVERVIEQTAVQMDELAKTKQELDESLKKLREDKNSVDQAVLVAEREQRALQVQLQNHLKEEGALQAKLERFDVSVDNHLNRLSQEYNLTYEAASQLETLNMSVQEAVSYVMKMKREIEQIGPVNMTAIEEYDQVFERFTFMSEQQSDLLQAKEQLLSTMSEMDQEVEKRFKETFFAIKAKFEKTFPKLFGGGRATLELTQPDNLLESGIDIIAQPPGKRLQNLSLLSGGEKAFTAIALLFAILEVKPVPFCLLDEVEAALDEANVGRYGRYLKSFIDQTQFIVITHRKGTMEEADVLYGVTMQESGVSKLASVKFEDYDDATN